MSMLRSQRRKAQTAARSYDAVVLEPFPFRLNRNGALFLVLTRFLHANR